MWKIVSRYLEQERGWMVFQSGGKAKRFSSLCVSHLYGENENSLEKSKQLTNTQQWFIVCDFCLTTFYIHCAMRSLLLCYHGNIGGGWVKLKKFSLAAIIISSFRWVFSHLLIIRPDSGGFLKRNDFPAAIFGPICTNLSMRNFGRATDGWKKVFHVL